MPLKLPDCYKYLVLYLIGEANLVLPVGFEPTMLLSLFLLTRQVQSTNYAKRALVLYLISKANLVHTVGFEPTSIIL